MSSTTIKLWLCQSTILYTMMLMVRRTLLTIVTSLVPPFTTSPASFWNQVISFTIFFVHYQDCHQELKRSIGEQLGDVETRPPMITIQNRHLQGDWHYHDYHEGDDRDHDHDKEDQIDQDFQDDINSKMIFGRWWWKVKITRLPD